MNAMVLKVERVAIPVFLAMVALAAPTNSLAASAEENFKWYCAQCHGLDGAGDGINSTVKELPVGPMDLSKSKEMKKLTDEEVIKTLTNGGPVNRLESLMPPWGNTLTKEEIKALMRHVRGLCKDADCPR